MKKNQILFLIAIVSIWGTVAPKSDIGLTPVQIIENHGYPVETHYITTEDGYILTYHRIPSTKPAIFLEHGMLSSSADYINMGNQSLGFFLSDAGYDVWLGNARGNSFSRNHTSLDAERDKKQFFDFSWHEIGYYDLPASIDYILALKQEDSLYYVGHSQGTTSFFVMASTRPEYNKKIKVAHMLAPSVFMGHCPNKLVVDISPLFNQLDKILEQMRIYELPMVNILRQVGSTLCKKPNSRFFCKFLFDMVINSTLFDKDMIPVLLTNFPSSISMKQIVHYGHLVHTGKFVMYDHGPKKNMKVYGTKEPPLYDISKITAPMAMYYGASDGIQAVVDVRAVIAQLKNVVLDYLVPRETFNHFDFILATDVVTLVYNKLLETNRNF